MVKQISKAQFNSVVDSDVPVLVDMFATWCGPCKMMSPVLDQIEAEMGDKARIVKIDVDQEQALANEFGVMGVPTFLVFKNGKLDQSFVGMQSKSTLIIALS